MEEEPAVLGLQFLYTLQKNSFFIKSIATEPFSLQFKSANPSPWLPPPLHLQPLGPDPGWTAARRNLSGSGVHFDTVHFLQCSGKMRKKAEASGEKEGERVRKWISVPISSTAPVSHPGRISNTMFYKLMFLEVGQGYPQKETYLICQPPPAKKGVLIEDGTAAG